MKSIVKTLFIGGVLFLGSNAIWAQGLKRCTCYHADSGDVGQCKAFTNCDVVYIDVYKQAGPDHIPWLNPTTGDKDYFLEAAKLATKYKRANPDMSSTIKYCNDILFLQFLHFLPKNQ